MAKIINVDFKEKKKEFTWDERNEEFRAKVIDMVDKKMKATLELICAIEDDEEFQKACAIQMANIVYNLRNR